MIIEKIMRFCSFSLIDTVIDYERYFDRIEILLLIELMNTSKTYKIARMIFDTIADIIVVLSIMITLFA